MSKKIISAILCLLLISFAVYADGVSVSVVYDTETDSVSVSGNADSDVTVTVLKNGTEPSDISAENPPVFFRFAESANGTYSLSFKMKSDAEGGKYDIFVSSKSGKAKGSFIRINKNIDPALLKALSAAASQAEFSDLLEKNSGDFGIDTDDENYDKYKDLAYKIMFCSGRTYKTASEVYYDYLTAYALSGVVLSENTDAALQSGADHLGFDYNADYKNDTRLSDAAKEKLLNLLKNEDWENVYSGCKTELREIFKERFSEYKVVSSALCAQTGGELKKIITEDYSDNFSDLLSNEQYKSLKSPEEVFSLMIKKSFTDMKTLRTAFSDAATKRYKEENKKTGSSGSSSSGGSSTGGGFAGSGVEIPAKDNTVDITERKTPFTDIKDYSWAKDSIESLYEKEIISGYDDDTFRPGEYITRAEFSKLIAEAFLKNAKGDSKADVSFSDVLKTDWFASFVEKNVKCGTILGYDGKFNPLDFITREDASVILYRIIKTDGDFAASQFDDENLISEYAEDAVSFLSSANIVRGRENNMFAPKDSITRAEAAVLISAALDYIDSLQN